MYIISWTFRKMMKNDITQVTKNTNPNNFLKKKVLKMWTELKRLFIMFTFLNLESSFKTLIENHRKNAFQIQLFYQPEPYASPSFPQPSTQHQQSTIPPSSSTPSTGLQAKQKRKTSQQAFPVSTQACNQSDN
ncbi:hypothetical protein BDA99DRAFT_538414 [Phascolomyces articulosus]|uniref:Uncharacterized protein n=1 Tax=Phascolomyces articulosus TaxID=60185 RepID=A0AAD5JXL7_9FUNG|nr:hypothetical protein BDA99DRAFT_538414 [Phascolomyces articulosus]